MAQSRNKHRLPRRIPDTVQRRVRQECHNGCVVCGRLPYQYEHFDPEFAQAKEHRAEGIALLCSGCHQDKTAGRLSVDKVRQARSAPYNLGRDAVWTTHLGPSALSLDLGGNVIQGSAVGLSINGSVLIGIKPPSTPSGDWLLTGSFADSTGRRTLEFHDNRVTVVSGSWDVTLEGRALTVRSGPSEIVARLLFDANSNVVRVEQLRMQLANGHKLAIDSGSLRISGPQMDTLLSGNQFIGNGTALQYGPALKSPTEFSTIAINHPALGTRLDWTNSRR